MYSSELYIDEMGAFQSTFRAENKVIAFLCVSSANLLAVLGSDKPVDYGFLKQGNGGTQLLYRYRYAADGTKIDNITHWALKHFNDHYASRAKVTAKKITKNDIFDYVYAVLHDPVYKEKYRVKLKREFPRIPLYRDFWKWADWGKALFRLHVQYDDLAPWKLSG